MTETEYLIQEIKNISNPGVWARVTGPKPILWTINHAVEACMPEDFGPGDKTPGRRIARLAWLNSVISHKIASSNDLYPVEAIRIRNWLDGCNLITGEDEPNQAELMDLRSNEIQRWMRLHWQDIVAQVVNRPGRRVRCQQPQTSSN